MTKKEAMLKFRSACEILEEISTKSVFQLYVANDTLCLMHGPSHDRHGIAQQDNVVAVNSRLRISGGDW